MVSRFLPFTPNPQSTTDPVVPTENPRVITPNNDNRIGPNPRPDASLANSLGALADDLRQMYTDFGLRPYRLFSIVTEWSGGEYGRGEERLVSEVEMLPTPRVSLAGLRGSLSDGGLRERGTLRVDQISPRYTEDDIYSLFHCHPLPPKYTGWIEMREDARDGDAPPRRRFVVIGTPARMADKFEWQVDLTQQDPSRNRLGRLNRTGDPAP